VQAGHLTLSGEVFPIRHWMRSLYGRGVRPGLAPLEVFLLRACRTGRDATHCDGAAMRPDAPHKGAATPLHVDRRPVTAGKQLR
jgi:hypothetical protein